MLLSASAYTTNVDLGETSFELGVYRGGNVVVLDYEVR